MKGAALGAIVGGAMQAVSNFFAGKNVWTGQGRTPDADLAPQKALTETRPEELGSGRAQMQSKAQTYRVEAKTTIKIQYKIKIIVFIWGLIKVEKLNMLEEVVAQK